MTHTIGAPSKPGGSGVFKSLRLANFKCYKGPTGDIPLKPLTLIIGPNNAGKSTILHALLLLKQTLADRSRHAALVTAGQWVDMGGFEDILHGGCNAQNRNFTIGVTRDEPDSVRLPHKQDDSAVLANAVDATFAFDKKRGEIVIQDVELRRDSKSVIRVQRRGKEWAAASISDRAKQRLSLSFQHFLPKLSPRPGAKPDMRVLRKAQELAMLLDFQTWVWENLFSGGLRHVAPVRGQIPWYSRAGRRATSDIGAGGENLLHLLAREDNPPGRKKPLLALVDDWVRKFRMLDRLQLESLDGAGMVRSLVGDDIGGCTDINVAAMGEGVAQMLPIVALSLLSRQGECLLIEQPELHLHPSAQADLADLFIENARVRRQFIIETHSEHLLLRVRRRVAEQKISADDVAILYVEKHGRTATIRLLELNGRGHFEDWPKGFFDEAYQEAMKLAMASAPKRCNV